MLYPSRLKQSGGGTGGTDVYIDGVKSTANRINLNNIIVSPIAISFGNIVVLNNEIHVMGGSYAQTSHYKWNGMSWSSVSTLPYSFKYGSAVVYNNEIHILGGNNTGTGRYHYKWNGTSWSSVSTIPIDVDGGYAGIIDNEVHIFADDPTNYMNLHYKWDGTSWTQVESNIFTARTQGYNENNKIYLIGMSSVGVYNNLIEIIGTPLKQMEIVS